MAALPMMQLRWRNLFDISGKAESIEVVDSSKLQGCSWMGLVQAGVSLSPTRGASQRLVIDSSLHFEARGHRCDRSTFLFLALGLSVDPFNTKLANILNMKDDVRSLNEMTGQTVMTIERFSSQAFHVQISSGSYSARQALAWFGVMVIKGNNKAVSFQSLIPSPHSKIGTHDSPPTLEKIKRCFEEVLDNMSLALAVRWACYVQKVYYEEGKKILPAPQEVLKVREDAIVELKRLDAMTLKTKLQAICNEGDGAGLEETLQHVLNPTQLHKKELPSLATHIADPHKSCFDMSSFLNKNSVFHSLYKQIDPYSHRQVPNWEEDSRITDSSPFDIAAKVWLAVSVIQLAPQSGWKTELSLDGLRQSRPDHTVLRKLLEDTDDNQDLKIYLG
ncbi:hypothetical protein BP5796_02871 [Coleophoma crateriformis]|uniref:Uncharacterized protein n=1 Tax=Coleophoma crateriformis TaxID=565419 RepID=A0A3D8SZI3_9HELO|nr:hypothetical protein BP5796_02871 [Coleophoma crateriformis]